MEKRWIIGLGNPGKKYEKTRHNLGFLCVSQLAKQWGVELSREKHQSLFNRAQIDDCEATLILPQTFMNLSGEALAEWKRREGMDPSRMLVVYDDMDLPLGKIRFRKEGSGGSHNGMASIIEKLATQDFPRLRLGVGKPANPEEWAGYVTSTFRPEEKEPVKAMLDKAVEAASLWLSEPLPERVMSKVNA